MYNLKEFHDPNKNYNGIKPYRNPYFSSIYQGMIVEIHIVDHCNLNCAGCNHFSPLAQYWNIKIEDFKKQLEVLKENVPVVKELILLGGEPTLHPDLPLLCEIARNIFPDIHIVVLSNGIKIDIIKNNAEIFKKLNIDINFCSYPGKTNFSGIKELNYPYFNTRNLLQQILVDKEGKQNSEQFFNCNNYRLPCFTLRDFKLYICPFSAHLHSYEKKSGEEIPQIAGQDYLNIEEIKGNLDIIQDFCFSEKNVCKYCKQSNTQWIWHQSYKDTLEYEVPLKELYFIDYERYDSIINNHLNYFINCYSKQNPAPVDLNYASLEQEKIIKRLLGKIDIIIPYYLMNNESHNKLLKSLCQQTIIDDCVIYFVSDNSDFEKSFIEEIEQTKLNYILLKTESRSGPGITRNLGFNKSYNKYVFFLDVDDYFCNSKALESLYNNAEKNQCDVIKFTMYSPTDEGNKESFLLSRKFLQTNNIKYSSLFFGEDMLFLAEILSKAKNIISLNNDKNIIAIYDRSNSSCLSKTILKDDLKQFNFLTSRYFSLQIKNSPSFIKNLITNVQDIYNSTRNDFTKVYSYWICLKFYESNPQDYLNFFPGDNKVIDFINNNYYIALSDQLLLSQSNIENYLKDNLPTDFYTINASSMLLPFLNSN